MIFVGGFLFHLVIQIPKTYLSTSRKFVISKTRILTVNPFGTNYMFNEANFKQFIVEAVFSAMAEYMPAQEAIPEKKYVYSIQGLADELHCSIVTAQKLKNSGRIPFKQDGRKCIFEINEILNAMSFTNGKKNQEKRR